MQNMKKKGIVGTLIFILLLIGVILLFNSIVITNENEYKLIKKFNKVERIISNAGISFKIPMLESTDSIPKQILLYDFSESEATTKDKINMVTDSYVLWKISDPHKFTKELNASIALAETRINTTVYNVIKNVISSLTQTEVISGRDGELTLAIMEGIGNSMDKMGIEIITVETKRLDLPSDNKTAVFERMISERDEIAATFKAQGEYEAQVIQNTTDKEIAISISDAKNDAAKTIAEGEAQYMRILSEAYSDPKRSEFYTFIRSLDAARASLSGADKTLILSEDSPIAQIFYQID